MMNRSKPDAEVATSCIALSIYTANPEYNVRASFRLVQAPIPPGAVRRGLVILYYTNIRRNLYTVCTVYSLPYRASRLDRLYQGFGQYCCKVASCE